jgi:hypothetical protein
MLLLLCNLVPFQHLHLPPELLTVLKDRAQLHSLVSIVTTGAGNGARTMGVSVAVIGTGVESDLGSVSGHPLPLLLIVIHALLEFVHAESMRRAVRMGVRMGCLKAAAHGGVLGGGGGFVGIVGVGEVGLLELGCGLFVCILGAVGDDLFLGEVAFGYFGLREAGER